MEKTILLKFGGQFVPYQPQFGTAAYWNIEDENLVTLNVMNSNPRQNDLGSKLVAEFEFPDTASAELAFAKFTNKFCNDIKEAYSRCAPGGIEIIVIEDYINILADS